MRLSRRSPIIWADFGMARSSTTRKKGDPALPGAGRKPIPPEVKKAFEDLVPESVELLKQFLRSADEKMAFAAMQEVFNRAIGKPVQPTDNKHAGADGEQLGIVVRYVKAGE